MLDEAGLTDCSIVASNSLDEFTIESILKEGAKIDSFGVGERLITAKSDPVFEGVYKMSAVEENGVFVPRIKVSASAAKITNPGWKKVWRIYRPGRQGRGRPHHSPRRDTGLLRGILLRGSRGPGKRPCSNTVRRRKCRCPCCGRDAA